MKKQGIKITSKVLAGLVLLTGITSLPTNAVEVKTAEVDVNTASVKAKVYELNGHYYAKLLADREVANVVARITTETKAEFVLKKELIKAGEEVVVELDMTAEAPTRKLPNTEVKREGFTAVNKVGTHTFNINVRYEIATDEVKAEQEENKKVVNPPATETKKDKTPTASSTNNEDKGNEAATKSEQSAAAPVENKKTVEAPKTTEPTVARPNTSDNETPSDKPAGLATKQPTTPVAGTDRSAVATPTKEEAKAAETKSQAVKEEKAATKTEAEKPKQQTQVAGSREEQIRKAFLAKVAQLRNINGLPALSENAALNSSSKNRSADVPTRTIDGNLHGPNGSIQYEKDAAKAAGYLNSILANVAITGDSGTPEQVAQQLFDILFKEVGNVVAKYPYGHRNTLLDATAKDVGAGVTIKNGQVYLVQHQSSNGAFNGTTPKAGKYLDGSNTIYRNGQPV